MKRRAQKRILIIALCFTLVLMGVGYAILSQTLNINGIARGTNTWSILIESITPKPNNTEAVSVEAVSNRTIANFTVDFKKPGDYMEYELKIINRGTIDAYIDSVNIAPTDPDSISLSVCEFTYDETVIGKTIKSGEYITFLIKMKYKESAETIPEGSASFELTLNSLQGEGPGESGGSSGGDNPGAENDWLYRVDSDGLITAFNYDSPQAKKDSRGKYIIEVPDSVDGIPVRKINKQSFKAQNISRVSSYTDGTYMIMVIEDENNFELLKQIGREYAYLYLCEASGYTGSELESCREMCDQFIKFHLVGDAALESYEDLVELPEEERITNVDVGAYLELGLSFDTIDSIFNVETNSEIVTNPNISQLDLSEATNLITIGDNAFNGQSIGGELVIPASVTTIGDSAFINNSINKLTIGTEPTVQNQFSKRSKYLVTKMTTVQNIESTLTSNLTSIGANAFKNNKITSLSIPSSLRTIGDAAFYGNRLTRVDLSGGNELISDEISGAYVTTYEGSNGTFTVVVEDVGDIGDIESDLRSIFLFYACELGTTNQEQTNQCKQFVSQGLFIYSENDPNLAIPELAEGASPMRAYVNLEKYRELGLSVSTVQQIIVMDTTNEISGAYVTTYEANNGAFTVVVEDVGDISSIESDLRSIFLLYACELGTTNQEQINQCKQFVSQGLFIYSESDPSLVIPELTEGASPIRAYINLEKYRELGLSISTIQQIIIMDMNMVPQSNIVRTTTGGAGLTKIGNSVFANNQISSLTIPNSVTTIGDFAFSSNQISSLTIPNGVITIGNSAFEYNQISELIIPKTVTMLAIDSFEGNPIENLTIGKCNTTICGGTQKTLTYEGTEYSYYTNDYFGNNIKKLTVESGEIGKCGFSSCSIATLLIQTELSEISEEIEFLMTSLERLTLGEEVTSIGQGAFLGNKIENVDLSNLKSLTKIETGVFAFNELSEVVIPSNVTEISRGNISVVLLNGDISLTGAFMLNTITDLNLTQATNLTIIGDAAFYQNQLSSLIVPNSVITIGSGAFSENQISSLALGNSVTTIGAAAFSFNQISSLTIPDSVTAIESQAFYQNQINSLTLGNSVTTIENSAFGYNQISGGLVIPDGVTTIGDRAFSENQISSLTIGSGVTSIGYAAFVDQQINSFYSYTLTSIIIRRTEQDFLANVAVASHWYDNWYSNMHKLPTITYSPS